MSNNIPRPSGGERVWVVNPTNDAALTKIVGAELEGGVPVSISDSSSMSPYGRLRVAQPWTLFGSKLLHNKTPLLYDEQITNNSGTASSTYSTTDSVVRMQVGSTDTIIRQTFERYNYQPGKGQLAFLTLNLLGENANVTKKVGLFDGTNGVYLKLSGSQLSFCTLKAGTEVSVLQNNWNKDTFDGNGTSGVDIDTALIQIFFIDFEWPGRVRMGFVVGGVPYVGHEFYHTNQIASVFMSTPNLPVRYEISASAGGSGALDHLSSSVMAESGFTALGKLFSATTGALVTLATQNTVYGMLAIRLRDTRIDLSTFIETFSALSDSAGDYYLHIILNPTLSSGSWSWTNVNETYSGMEYADGGNTVVINGGVYLTSIIATGREYVLMTVNNERNLGAAIDGTKDIIALAIQPLSNNQDCGATINWREV